MKEPFISFEGVPIIIGAPVHLAEWQGIETNDYEDLCAVFDARPTDKVQALPNRESNCIAADFGGAGTIRIFERSEGMMLVRAWPANPDSSVVYVEATTWKHDEHQMGEFVHDSDTIAVAWAAERLVGLPHKVERPERPELDLAIEDSVLLYPLAGGKYRWEWAEFEMPSGAVIRLTIKRA